MKLPSAVWVRTAIFAIALGAALHGLLSPTPALAEGGKIAVYLGSQEALKRFRDGSESWAEPDSLRPFGRSRLTEFGDGPEWVGIGDLDGDGHADIAAIDSGERRVGIFRGSGAGRFGQPILHCPGTKPPRQGLLRDMTGDGIEDLVVLCSTDDAAELVLIRILSEEEIQTRSLAVFEEPMWSFALEDLNGDGIPDLVASGLNRGDRETMVGAPVTVRLGLEDGGFSEPVWTEGLGAPAMLVEDLNEDGIPDLAATHWFSGVFVYPGEGDGTFGDPVRACTGFGPFHMAAGDLNRDGAQDLVISSYFFGISVLHGNGDGTFVEPDSLNLAELPSSPREREEFWQQIQELVNLLGFDYVVDTTNVVCASRYGDYMGDAIVTGDLDGDGNEEILLGQSGYKVQCLWGDGADPDSSLLSVGFRPRDLALGDLNEDGIDDLVVAGIETPGILDNLGTWSPSRSDPAHLFDHGNFAWETVSPRGDGLQYGRSAWGFDGRLVPAAGLPGRWDLWTSFGFRLYPGADSTATTLHEGSEVTAFRKELEWSFHTHFGLQYGSKSQRALIRPRVGLGPGLYYFGTDETYQGDGVKFSRKFNHQFRAGWQGFAGADVMAGPQVGISLELRYDHVWGLDQLPGGIGARGGGRYVSFAVGLSGYWYKETKPERSEEASEELNEEAGSPP